MDKQTIKWWIEHASCYEGMYNATAAELVEYQKALNHAMTALITAGWMIDKEYPIEEVLEEIDNAIIEYRGFMEQRFPDGDR